MHRDLKPANILVDQALVPRVTDFGLAKRMELGSDLTRTGQILDTPGYMAPEQAAGECREVGPAADIYALGAILYCCLIGRPRFQAANVIDTLVQVLESEPTMPRKLNATIPRPLERICLRCLERSPTDRYPSAKELAADLDRFLQDQPVLAQPLAWIERLSRFSRKSPALVSHLISLALMLLIAQVQYFSRSSETLEYHLQISGLLTTWALASLGFDQLEDHKRLGPLVNPSWLCLDVIMLSCLLGLLSTPETPPGPLLIGYPMLIVGGGMFFRVRLVWLVTIAAMLSYVALIIARQYLLEPLHYHVSFLLILSAIGVCVAHQVRRVRVLGEYFEARR